MSSLKSVAFLASIFGIVISGCGPALMDQASQSELEENVDSHVVSGAPGAQVVTGPTRIIYAPTLHSKRPVVVIKDRKDRQVNRVVKEVQRQYVVHPHLHHTHYNTNYHTTVQKQREIINVPQHMEKRTASAHHSRSVQQLPDIVTQGRYVRHVYPRYYYGYPLYRGYYSWGYRFPYWR